ncbi:MAG: hypothetical protein WAK40_03235 [Thermoplasmata archaeon]
MIRITPAAFGAIAAALLLSSIGGTPGPLATGSTHGPLPAAHTGTPSAVANFTAAINRMVELVGLAGSGILALVWARVALSWFSNDVTKKIQAKDRARDALVGSLLFTAAVTGLAWGLAHWVITGA